MSYVHTTRRDRKADRQDVGAASAQHAAGALTYLVFALSVGFAAAVVLGFVA